MFAPLFFVIALEVPALLIWRGIVRVPRESLFRGIIIILTLGLGFYWLLVSVFMLNIVFATAWGLAHTRRLPRGFFPEWWLVDVFLAAIGYTRDFQGIWRSDVARHRRSARPMRQSALAAT